MFQQPRSRRNPSVHQWMNGQTKCSMACYFTLKRKGILTPATCCNMDESFFFWLCWVFIAVSRGYIAFLLLFQSISSRLADFSSCVRTQLPCSTWDLSSWTRDQTCVPCIARQILNPWTTRDVPTPIFIVAFTILLEEGCHCVHLGKPRIRFNRPSQGTFGNYLETSVVKTGEGVSTGIVQVETRDDGRSLTRHRTTSLFPTRDYLQLKMLIRDAEVRTP